MIKYLLFTVVFFSSVTVALTQDTPSQKELEAMMKEVQKEMDNLDPETKRMMDSMGIKMPSMNAMPKMSDAELKKAYEMSNRIVPVKDVARISAISKARLNTSSLPGYVTGSHNKVVAQLKPASKSRGEEIYQTIKAQHNSPAVTGKTAAGLWMMGKTELALYVMGKACIDDPSSTDNLNNYASMLSMSGGEEMAIPMLEYLNKKFPKNSTLLNNLGQAWFGLGELDKAGKYLDSTIRIYSFHSQANMTKSRIEESKGNKTAAVESIKKSIKNAYSTDKQTRLDKLGYELKSKDIDWKAPMPKDAMGLEKFNWPSYPMDVGDSELREKEWQAFRKLCQGRQEVLNQKLAQLEKSRQERFESLARGGKTGNMALPFPQLSPKAFKRLAYLVEDKDGQRLNAETKNREAVRLAMENIGRLEPNRLKSIELLDKSFEDRFGEGKENPFEAACEAYNQVNSNYLNAVNKGLLEANTTYLNTLRRQINDQMYYNQYTMWSEDFEFAKILAQLQWVSQIANQKVVFLDRSSYCNKAQEKPNPPSKLSEFDDVNCQYHSKLTLPLGSITVDCSRVTSELSVAFLKLGLKQDMNRETFGDQFMSCSVEVGAGVSKGVSVGPLKAEASIGGAVAVEIDRQGISDIVIKGGAGYSAGTDIIEGGSHSGVGVSDLSIDVGVQGQISLISGHSSVESTGILSGAFKK